MQPARQPREVVYGVGNGNANILLLARRVRAPVRFHLEEHRRCPSRFAEVIERASERYADVVKEVRPAKQRRQAGGQHVDAHLAHVQVAAPC